MADGQAHQDEESGAESSVEAAHPGFGVAAAQDAMLALPQVPLSAFTREAVNVPFA